MDQNPYESPREPTGTKASKPIATLGGVIRLLCIAIGLFVAIAVVDFIGMSICTWTSGPLIPPIQRH